MEVKIVDISEASQSGKVRLDPEYWIFISSQAGRPNTQNMSEVMSVSWVPACQSIPKLPFRYCEIGNIDHFGRIAPFLIEDEEEIEPESAKQRERLLKKINDGKISQIEDWAVIAPKTRPYKKKYGLLSGNEKDTYFTTDLLLLEPGPLLLEKVDDRGQAVCLLWVMLLRTILGDHVTALSRWGKTYPTITPDDLQSAPVDWAQLNTAMTQIKAVQLAKRVQENMAGCMECSENIIQAITGH